MNAFRGQWEKLLRQRLPFLPLVAAACAGCLLARLVEIQTWLMFAGACALLARCLVGKAASPTILCLGVFAAFATLQAWEWRESPARMVAEAWPGPVHATVEGRVEDAPTPSGADRWLMRVETRTLSLPGWSGPLRIFIQVSLPGEPPQIGDQIRATGSFSAFRKPRNPGEFDVRAWMAGRGMFSRLFVAAPQDTTLIAKAQGFSLRRMAWHTREWIKRTLTEGLDPASQQAQLMLAMTLGETRSLDEGLLEDFRRTGTFHLFSVSGLHVGMLGVLLWIGLSTAGVPRTAIVVLIIPALFYYALVTGWKPASVRAATMAAFVLVGTLAGRPPTVVNSLLAAAFFILLCNTNELFNAGFQFSFSVVLSLVILAGPLTHVLQSPLKVDPFIPPALYTRAERLRDAAARNFAPVLAVAVVAWIGSLLLTIEYFHLLSLSAILTNVLCVPLAFVAMAVAMLSLTSGVISQALAALFNNTNWLISGALIAIVKGMAALPGSALTTTWPEPGRPEAQLVIFDFGRGSATAIQAGGDWWLLDAGPAHYAERALLPFFQQKGVAHLEGLVLTHGDSQHIGGAEAVIRSLRPRKVFESGIDDRSPTRRRVREFLAGSGRAPLRITAGDVIATSANSSMHVFYPPRDMDAELADDKALIVLFEAAGWRILFLSDAGRRSYEWLKEHGRVPEADVIITGAHTHGSLLDSDFLAASRPKFLVAGNARFPSSEPLPESTRQAARMTGVNIVTLDETGALILEMRRGKLVLRGFYDGSRRILEH